MRINELQLCCTDESDKHNLKENKLENERAYKV